MNGRDRDGGIKRTKTAKWLLLVFIAVLCGGLLSVYAFSPSPEEPPEDPPETSESGQETVPPEEPPEPSPEAVSSEDVSNPVEPSPEAPSPEETPESVRPSPEAPSPRETPEPVRPSPVNVSPKESPEASEPSPADVSPEETPKPTERRPEAVSPEAPPGETPGDGEPPAGLGVEPGGEDGTGEPSSLPARYWWAFVLGGGILVLGGAVLGVRLRKKPAAAQVPAPARPPLSAYPVLIGNTHHIGARENQQDSFILSDISNTELCRRKGILGVVADGMGGMADGAEASAIVSKTMLHYFNEIGPSGQPEQDLLNMLFAANDNVSRFMSGGGQGGSTVVAVILHDGKLYWVSVGDSRIYLIRNGAVMQLNREHTYAAELDVKAAAGEISWEEAARNPKRGALTSYLGIGKLEMADRNDRPTQLLDGDKLLLMSDGVFGVLSDEEILWAMAYDPREGAAKLQEMILAKQNPRQDNFTAVIFQYNIKVDV